MGGGGARRKFARMRVALASLARRLLIYRASIRRRLLCLGSVYPQTRLALGWALCSVASRRHVHAGQPAVLADLPPALSPMRTQCTLTAPC